MSETNNIISIDELYGVYRESDPQELIIDLRAPDDYKVMHIENSLSLPVNRIEKSSFDFKAKKRIYLVCKEGKEAPLATVALSAIYTGVKVYHVATGGFDEWFNKKYPVVSGLSEDATRRDSDLEQNDSDGRNMEKKTRLLPEALRAEISPLLQDHQKIFFFKDRGRNCYLVCDLIRHQAIVFNPLIEIHHHIIDQMVRVDCDCVFTIFFENLNVEGSPSSRIHSEDFAKLTSSVALEAKSNAAIEKIWNGEFASRPDLDSDNEVVVWGKILFTKKPKTNVLKDLVVLSAQ